MQMTRPTTWSRVSRWAAGAARWAVGAQAVAFWLWRDPGAAALFRVQSMCDILTPYDLSSLVHGNLPLTAVLGEA